MRQEFSKAVKLGAWQRCKGHCRPTRDDLVAILAYDPDSGIFRWKKARVRARIGTIAGSRRPDGYWTIVVDGRTHYAHCLAWLYMTGSWPEPMIDHINRDKSDNRWSNLRIASYVQNLANTPKRITNKSGFKGVSPAYTPGKWIAQIGVNGKRINLGTFATAKEASEAYQRAAKLHFGEYVDA